MTMTTLFAVETYKLNDSTKLSVSTWDDNSSFRGSVGIKRNKCGRWELDYGTVTEVRTDDSLKRTAIVASIATDLAHSETGEWLRLKELVE